MAHIWIQIQQTEWMIFLLKNDCVVLSPNAREPVRVLSVIRPEKIGVLIGRYKSQSGGENWVLKSSAQARVRVNRHPMHLGTRTLKDRDERARRFLLGGVMRLMIELTGRTGVSPGRKTDVMGVILMLLVPALALGCLLIFGAVYRSDPPSGMSVDDDNIIRQHLREISPPPPVGTRLHNALLALEANASASTDPPLVVTGLMIGPGGIMVTTQSNGVHIYDRQTKTWQTSEDDGSNSDPTIPDGTTDDAQPTNTNTMQVSADVSNQSHHR
jgi:hypothetical protein